MTQTPLCRRQASGWQGAGKKIDCGAQRVGFICLFPRELFATEMTVCGRIPVAPIVRVRRFQLKVGNDAGWCDNDEIRRAVWGDASNRNRLHVAVFRLRKLLEDAGFNPKCVDKERGYTRLNVEDVDL